MSASNRKTIRLRWSFGIGIAILLAAGTIWWTQRCPTDVGTLVELECSHQGGNATGDYPWNLKVDATGNGMFVEGRTERAISVPHGIHEFQNALLESRFCDLPSQIGFRVVDGGRNTIRIKTTRLDKTIALGYVDPDHRHDPDVLRAEALWALAEDLAKPPESIPPKK